MTRTLTSRARRARFRGEVEHRDEAGSLLAEPGDVAIVNRGRLRSAVIACPDGCGSVLTINLDPRSGRAWRLYQDNDRLSLYPSVWRDSGCAAHFILLKDRIIWCGPREFDAADLEYEVNLEARVHEALDSTFVSLEALSDKIDEIPWEVSGAANRLCKKGVAVRRFGHSGAEYRLASEIKSESQTPTQGFLARLASQLRSIFR